MSLIYLLAYEGTVLPFHSSGSLLEDLCVSRLSIRGQWAGLWGVVEDVVHQRWIVVRNVVPVTHTDLSSIAPAGSRGRKVGGEKVHLVDRVTWNMETRNREHTSSEHSVQRYDKAQEHPDYDWAERNGSDLYVALNMFQGRKVIL